MHTSGQEHNAAGRPYRVNEISQPQFCGTELEMRFSPKDAYRLAMTFSKFDESGNLCWLWAKCEIVKFLSTNLLLMTCVVILLASLYGSRDHNLHLPPIMLYILRWTVIVFMCLNASLGNCFSPCLEKYKYEFPFSRIHNCHIQFFWPNEIDATKYKVS